MQNKTKKITKQGNSLGVNIPAPFASQLGLQIGTEVNVILEDDQIIITRAKQNKFYLPHSEDSILDALEQR